MKIVVRWSNCNCPRQNARGGFKAVLLGAEEALTGVGETPQDAVDDLLDGRKHVYSLPSNIEIEVILPD